jgi:hypothetical protein
LNFENSTRFPKNFYQNDLIGFCLSAHQKTINV